MAQPCLERRTESANPKPITPDTCPSSENVSFAEPKWYTNAYLLGRVFKRVELLGTIQEHRRNFAGLSSSMGLVERERERESMYEPNTQYKTIPRHLSTEAIQAVVYAFAKIHKRLARVPLPQLHMYAHRYRQAHPSVRCESAHCVAHVLCRSNKARKHFSQHMSFLGTTCVQEPSADPAKPLNCHLFSLRR